MYALLGARLCPGIEMVLDALSFDRMLEGADLVITGEGRLDRQTTMGKAPGGVLARARKQNIPVVAIAGPSKPRTNCSHRASPPSSRSRPPRQACRRQWKRREPQKTSAAP